MILKGVMKTKKPKSLPHVDSWVKVKLRHASIYWAGRTEALKQARVAPGKYKCDSCQTIFGMIKIEGIDKKGRRKVRYKNPLELDHKDSVMPMDGSGYRKDNVKRIDWNSYIDRLFVGPEMYNKLCVQCHSVKTELENLQRMYYKNEKKKE